MHPDDYWYTDYYRDIIFGNSNEVLCDSSMRVCGFLLLVMCFGSPMKILVHVFPLLPVTGWRITTAPRTNRTNPNEAVHSSPTIRDLSVADVLQVGHRVVIARLGAALLLLQTLRRLSRREFGARLGRDAAWHRVPHSKPGVGFSALRPSPSSANLCS